MDSNDSNAYFVMIEFSMVINYNNNTIYCYYYYNNNANNNSKINKSAH